MLKILDDNFNLHSRKIPALTTEMQVVSLPGLSYVDSGLLCDTFNIIHITDGFALSEEDLIKTANHFNRKRSPFCIWISNENLNEKTKDIFEKASLKLQNSEVGMVLNLSQFESFEVEVDENIQIADTDEAIMDFAEVISRNWDPPDKNVISYFKMTSEYYLDKSNQISLAIYYYEGKAVSAMEIFRSDSETVGFYSLATLTDFRSRGIGLALMTFALNKVKREGYKNGVLQATDDGLRLYQKLGFEVITKYHEFTQQ